MSAYENQPALVPGHHISQDGLIFCDTTEDFNRPSDLGWGEKSCIDCGTEVTSLVEFLNSYNGV